MPTVRYGDVVNANKTLDGKDLEKKLRNRRQASQESAPNSEASEDQQTEETTEHESK